MRFAFYTLGCKTNQYETQAMEQLLTELGHEIGQFDQPCDGYIINTCSVTAVADKKNRAVIRRCRRDNPDAVIGVCGCYSQHAPEAVRALGVDIIGGSGGRREFVELMLSAMEGKTRVEQLDNALRRREFAMLQSIGMTTKQLRRMLMTEGLYYTAAAGFLSLALGGILSLVIADGLLSNLWFFTYTFTLLPLLLVIPLLLLIGALIPVIVLQSVKKQSIVDRLREGE